MTKRTEITFHTVIVLTVLSLLVMYNKTIASNDNVINTVGINAEDVLEGVGIRYRVRVNPESCVRVKKV